MAKKEKKNWGPEFCRYCNSKEFVLRKVGKTTVKDVKDTYGYDSEGNQTRYKYVDIHGNQATERHRNNLYLPVCQSCWDKKDRMENSSAVGFLLMLLLGAIVVIVSYLLFPDILWAKADGFKFAGQLSFKGVLVRLGIFFLPFMLFSIKVGTFVGKTRVGKDFVSTYNNGGTGEYHQFIKDNNLERLYQYEWEDHQ